MADIIPTEEVNDTPLGMLISVFEGGEGGGFLGINSANDIYQADAQDGQLVFCLQHGKASGLGTRLRIYPYL